MTSRLLGKIDLSRFNLGPEVSYLNGLHKSDQEYDGFAQGYWKNIPLINSSGDIRDTQYKNTSAAYPTEYLKHCPELQRLISESFRTANLTMLRAEI